MSKLILLILLLGMAESLWRRKKIDTKTKETKTDTKTEKKPETTKYEVRIITENRTDEETTGPVTITLEGLGEKLNVTQVLDNPDGKFFKAGAEDTFEFISTTNIRRVSRVNLTVTSDAAWKVNTVIVGSDRQKQEVYLYNTADQWMSTDAEKGVRKLELCSQGLASYKVEVKTADEPDAGSGNIRAQITFSDGKLTSTSGILDDFTKGETKTIEIHNMQLYFLRGLQCVTISAGADDAWLIDRIKVERFGFGVIERFKKPPLESVNDKKDWLSSDKSKGKNKIEFCRPSKKVSE